MSLRGSGIAIVVCAWLTSCVQPVRLPMAPHASAVIEPSPLPLAPRYPSNAEVAAEPLISRAIPSVASSSVAGWRAEQPVTESLATGGAMRVTVRVTDGSSVASLEAIVFDSRRCGIRVIDQRDPNAGGGAISAAMRQCGAVGGVNGGYFTPEFHPLGLMIAAGRPTGTIGTSNLLGGVLASTNGTPRLLWRSEYTRLAGTTDLIQSGPRLVDDSRSLPKLDRLKSRPRTFIATDGRHAWAVGVVKSVSLGELADLLSSPGILPDFHVARALNLDGGRSSAIWMRTAAGEEISQPGWSAVRNFIAVVPRP